jgi:hypothetical protein
MIIAILIHIIFPIAGILIFTSLNKKMKNEKVDKPPRIDLALIILNYGVLLYILTTELFWGWSAIASLITFYLILVVPIIMGIIGYRNYKNRKRSKYHNWIYKLGLFYCILIAISVVAIRGF